MRDSTKMLNFDTNRELNFDPSRGVDFESQRDLVFDLNRDLSFDLDRELDIRKRGVIFRGYVCPVCGAAVASDTPDCDECGVQFKPAVKEEKKETQKAWVRGEKTSGSSTVVGHPSHEKSRSRKQQSKKASKRQEYRDTFQCPVCGKLLYTGTGTCPGCEMEFGTSEQEEIKPQTKIEQVGPRTCTSCGYDMPASDGFCRRCGAPVGEKKAANTVTVSWDEYKGRNRKDGIISWDEFSDEEFNNNRGGEKDD